jgi:hypothetical protein
MSEITLTRDQYLEFEKIGLGAFAPLQGFMNEHDFRISGSSCITGEIEMVGCVQYFEPKSPADRGHKKVVGFQGIIS